MNRKQLTLLIVFGVLLGGLGWLAYQKQKAPYEESTRRMGEKLLPDFPLNDVTHVTIRQTNAEVNLVKKDETWTVKERGDYPANFSNLSDLLRKIWEMKIAKPVKVGASRLPQLELLPPDKGPGTLLEFKDNKGKAVAALLLGAKHTKEASGASPFGGGSWPDGRYVMIGNDVQSVALISDPLTSAEPDPAKWLNKDWFKVEKLRSVSVTTTNATNNWKLTRETESGEWKLAEAKAEEKLDTGKSSGATGVFSYAAFHDVAHKVTDETSGLAKPVLASLETFDGFTYTVKLGNKASDDKFYFQLAVAGSFPRERTPAKDEKPEDKEKLDKEFKEKSQKLEEKLKTEKAFEKWTYLVDKWTVDALLKERKDLLAEMKEEPKPDAATPAPAAKPESK